MKKAKEEERRKKLPTKGQDTMMMKYIDSLEKG
jgi:hypothetical protein